MRILENIYFLNFRTGLLLPKERGGEESGPRKSGEFWSAALTFVSALFLKLDFQNRF